jgi:hypothetical protein
VMRKRKKERKEKNDEYKEKEKICMRKEKI